MACDQGVRSRFGLAIEHLVAVVQCGLRSRSDVAEHYLAQRENPALARVMYRVFN